VLYILIRTLSKIVIDLNKSFVTQFVLPSLLRPIVSSQAAPSSVDRFLLDQISQIAACGDIFAYNTIVEFLLNDYRSVSLNPTSERSKFIHNTVPTNFHYITSHLQSRDLLSDFMFRMLNLFEKIGIHLQRKRMVERVGVVGALAVLLPIVSDLLSRVSKNADDKHRDGVSSAVDGSPAGSPSNAASPIHDKAGKKLLRNIWYFIVTFGFVDQHRILPEWYNAVRTIARNVPVLLSEGSSSSLEFEVEIQSFLRNGVEDMDSETRKTLQSRLPTLSQAQIRDLTPSQAAYSLYVFHAEMLRASQGKLVALFSYLSHISTLSPPLLPVIRAIADVCFNPFIENLKTRKVGSENWLRKLENRMQFLMVSFCHQEPDIRGMSDKYICGMVQVFPELLWSRRCLHTVLHLLEGIASGRNAEDVCVEIRVPDCKYSLLLPEAEEDRVMLLHLMSRLSSVWLETAIAQAPLEFGSILQDYIQNYRMIADSHAISSPSSHMGLSFAINAGIQGKVPVDPPPPASTRQTVASYLGSEQLLSVMSGFGKDVTKDQQGAHNSAASFLSALKTKSLFAGEVSGMSELLALSLASEKEATMAQIVTRVTQSLSVVMSKIRSFSTRLRRRKYRDWDEEEGKPLVCPDLDTKQFVGDVCRGAALLNQLPAIDPTLLHAICWAPFVAYTPESLECGVFAWRWLIAARPEFHLHILTELREVWCWTIEERIGLFSDVERDPSPLSVHTELHDNMEEEEVRKYHRRFCDVRPHRMFIDWLVEHFAVASRGQREEKAVFEEIIVGALRRPLHFSTLPQSMTSRFRLLLFALDFLHGQHHTSPVSESLIRAGVYSVACRWFCSRPVWLTFSSRPILEREVGHLIAFCKALEKDRAFLSLQSGPDVANLLNVAWLEEVYRDIESGYAPSMSDASNPAVMSTTSSGTRRRTSTVNVSDDDPKRWRLKNPSFSSSSGPTSPSSTGCLHLPTHF
jgi:phosphatidylinositol 4-kinase